MPNSFNINTLNGPRVANPLSRWGRSLIHVAVFQVATVGIAAGQNSLGHPSAGETKVDKQNAAELALPSKQLENIVIRAFAATHAGWSSDEVLLNDRRRQAFVGKSKELESGDAGPASSDDAFCRALLHVRKSGGKLPKATKRASRLQVSESDVGESELLAAAEIAARRLSDQMHRHTDAILVDKKARRFFDEHAHKVCPDASPYALRKSALRLRKTRQLEPELLARVTDWKLELAEFTASDLKRDFSAVPTRPGIYLFRDKTGYLYIGQASNLRTRLTSHLTDSDRINLGQYLNQIDGSEIVVELHVFKLGSPGEKLRTRRAYESELIRTRSPRLNLAP